MTPIDVITISREYGAGARELAGLLSHRLGWRVLDAQIPIAVAERLHVSPDARDEWDEHAPGILESVGNALMLGTPELLIDPAVASRPEARDVARATKEYLLAEGSASRTIIVGHGGQLIFAARPGTLHLRLVAPVADRVRRICTRRDCGEREAAEICRRVDADRAHFAKEFLGHDSRDPLLYHLEINTGRIAMADVVTMVAALVGAD